MFLPFGITLENPGVQCEQKELKSGAAKIHNTAQRFRDCQVSKERRNKKLWERINLKREKKVNFYEGVMMS